MKQHRTDYCQTRRRIVAASALLAAAPGAFAQGRAPAAPAQGGRWIAQRWGDFGISASERSWLRGIRDALERQVRRIPLLDPPTGFDVVHYPEANGELLLGSRRASPIRGKFDWAVYVPVFKTIYDPVSAVVTWQVNQHFRELILDPGGKLPPQWPTSRPVLRPIPEAGGLPGFIKRDARGQFMQVVLTSSGRLPWKQLTVEEFLRLHMQLVTAEGGNPLRAQQVARLERELAGFSSAERASPAYVAAPPPDSDRTGVTADPRNAVPMSIVDPEFYDPRKPRESLQYLGIEVSCPGASADGAQHAPGSARERLSALTEATLANVDWAGLRALVQGERR